MKITTRKSIAFACMLLVALIGQAETSVAKENKEILPPNSQQSTEVKGKVVDKSGNPIVGATIAVKGTGKGVATLNNGTFTLKIGPNDKVLIVSFVGMKSVEIAAPRNGVPITITMEDDAQMIEDVIITGYGTYKKSAYAGSAASVKTEALKDIPTTNLSQMLQGVATGVTLTGSSNQPGSAAQIRIRGMGSFNASNDPLYVIDGVPVTSGNISTLGTSNGGLDIMSTINPSDIENITVIKDAAAASLYGSRAANGVILIKTKSGKSGKPTFSFKGDWGFTDFATRYRTPMGGEERRNLIYEGLINQATIQNDLSAADAKTYADSKIDEYAPKPWNGWADWEDILFRKGFHQNYEVSATGGSDKLKYYTSIGYTQQEGVSYQSELERISGRLNVSYKMTPKLELGANILFSEVQQDVNTEGSVYTSPLYSSKNTVTPSNAPFNQDGSYATDFPRNGDRNPKSTADLNYDKEWINRSFNTVFGSYDLTSNLKIKSTFSYDFSINKGRSWRDPRTSDGAKDNGRTDKVYSDRKYWVWTNILSFEKTFKEKHNVDAVIGYEVDSKFRDELYGTKKNFPSINDRDIENGSIPYAVGGYFRQTRMVSYISKLNYNYDNKYYLGGSFRRDGSSKLASKNRWGNFWSVSGAWRVTGEDFMNSISNIITDMKLRASYGVNATLPSDYYGYLNLTSYGNDYYGVPGIAESQIAYENLTWESNYNINLGIDLSLFNRINLTAEWYQRKTKDLLIDKPLTLTSGFSTILTNEGQMLNRGIEVDIKTTNIQQKDFNWTTFINISHNKNEILRLDGVQQQIPSGSQIRKVGSPYYTLYLREFAGINPSNGMPQFYTNTVDANGKLVKDITEDPSKANPIVGKSISPKLTGGISNYINYKFIDLGFTFSYSLGGYSYDNGAQKLEHGGSEPDGNIPTYYRDRWKKAGDHAKYEIFIVDNSMAMSDWSSTRRVHSTDHLRLKNFTVGASLPSRWAKSISLTKARVFFSASNLLTWAAYDDYDPEVPESGSVYFELPPLKTLTFGVELNF
ncbi:SusC/RagA family TonB-linked outer membrane protein [Acetobacteroides hydrogenigenes]|uniref:TonB-linked SusC/RagA family outer membrane protein n=1 Tax=Acetobacteroides hydrogenigenes TaxID=979970 RepID=A0A4R2E4T0_9BACT|nr:TonB-dependent receptor [Acetobacteroides hydrogenigenes]TCN62873.1 TonB-linked SusC/RagA family outer membrane protein [Acetobacteroides hydrogenigenes]